MSRAETPRKCSQVVEWRRSDLFLRLPFTGSWSVEWMEVGESGNRDGMVGEAAVGRINYVQRRWVYFMESVILVMLAWCESRGLGVNRVGLRNTVCNSLICGLSNEEPLNCCSENWEAGVWLYYLCGLSSNFGVAIGDVPSGQARISSNLRIGERVLFEFWEDWMVRQKKWRLQEVTALAGW